MKLGKVLVYNGFAVIFLTRLDFDLFFVVDFLEYWGIVYTLLISATKICRDKF